MGGVQCDIYKRFPGNGGCEGHSMILLLFHVINAPIDRRPIMHLALSNQVGGGRCGDALPVTCWLVHYLLIVTCWLARYLLWFRMLTTLDVFIYNGVYVLWFNYVLLFCLYLPFSLFFLPCGCLVFLPPCHSSLPLLLPFLPLPFTNQPSPSLSFYQPYSSSLPLSFSSSLSNPSQPPHRPPASPTIS